MTSIRRYIIIEKNAEYAKCVMEIPWRYLQEYKDTYEHMINPKNSVTSVLERMTTMISSIENRENPE